LARKFRCAHPDEITMKPDDRLRHLMPLRDLPAAERARLCVQRSGRGRPREILPAPPPGDTYLEELDALRREAAEADPVLAAAGDANPRVCVLQESMRALAEECSAVKFLRVEREKRGADIGSLASRRVSGLSQLASLVVERARLGGENDFDPDDPRVRKVVESFLDVAREAVEQSLDPETGKAFMTAYMERLRGWEDAVR
jgi:hypothetical protein